MYKIYADETLIYDSEADDLKIGKGQISLETNKSGSFTFSVYPDHPFYDSFVKLRTVITVYKSGRIVFRGRILNDVTDYWNNKTLTCEGELGFLNDSIVRPYNFNGTPAGLFFDLIELHNEQVNEFKRFKPGICNVYDPNNYIARSNSGYESVLNNLNTRLLEDSLGGYLYITHGDDGTDPVPTINYVADLPNVASQYIEFGSNLKNYTKTVQGDSIATVIIPLGAQIEGTENERLTIKSVNHGVDFIMDDEAAAIYGIVAKVVTWDDVTVAANLLTKARAYLENSINQLVTIELSAVDLHMLDRSIDSYGVNDYVRVVSEPHNIAETYLCQKQTMDLLNPGNDTITLGRSFATFTGNTVKLSNVATQAAGAAASAAGAAANVAGSVAELRDLANQAGTAAQGALTAAGNAETAANQTAANAADAKAAADLAAAAANTAATAVGRVSNDVKALGEKTAAYKIAEQQMTSLLAQSFGVFKTEEVLQDGSTISYLHDKPLLANSSTVWAMTGDGMGVSTDGGKTWHGGIDSTGNARVNILSAIGIQANWIEAENLAAISANLGGWLIDNQKIYKEIQHPSNSRIRYRVYFKPPTSSSGTVSTEILTCQASADSGSTWTDLLMLNADGAAVFHSANKGTYKISGSYVELIDADGVQIARIGTQSRVSNEITSRAAPISTYSLEEDEIIEEEDPIIPPGGGGGSSGGGAVEEEIIEEVIYENKHRPEVVLKENTGNEFQAILNTTGLFFGNSDAANMAYIELRDGGYRLAVDEILVRGDITVEGDIKSYGGGIWTDEGGGYDGYVNGMYFRGGVLVSVE